LRNSQWMDRIRADLAGKIHLKREKGAKMLRKARRHSFWELRSSHGFGGHLDDSIFGAFFAPSFR